MNSRAVVEKEFYFLVLLFIAAFATLVFVAWDSLVYLADQWSVREEYSHGLMIPFIALYLLLLKKEPLLELKWQGSLLFIPVLIAGFILMLLGELSSIYEIIQYGFIVSLVGLFIAFWGRKPSLLVWTAFAYLIFMVPLPNFLHVKLSSGLQLISSELGVAFLRAVGVSVYQEGNIIDLGVYQLQVVEACSGLRYLFPLMSFGFLVNCLYQAPRWQKILLFLSTIPITILMNSLRIGIIGVTVDNWGIEMAEGVLHDFEGWVVFMACLGVLFFEMYLLHLFSKDGKTFLDKIDVAPISFSRKDLSATALSSQTSYKPIALGLLVTGLLAFTLNQFEDREALEIPRSSFNSFPLMNDEWTGKEKGLDRATLEALDLTDYIMADYVKQDSNLAVNFYVAWYALQTKGQSIHSPSTCLPGGGWSFDVLEQVDVPLSGQAQGEAVSVNRVVMTLGEHRQLVYYWFQGRDRNITNEYLAKWYIFWDSLTRNRTDGALVRLVTYVPEGTDVAEADQRLNNFMSTFYPTLTDYVPD